MVNIGLRVLARPQATMLPDMYRKLGLDFDERVLPSIMNEVCVQYCTLHSCICMKIFFFKTKTVTVFILFTHGVCYGQCTQLQILSSNLPSIPGWGHCVCTLYTCTASLYPNVKYMTGYCCIISRLSEFCIGHFMPYYMPVGLINGHLVCYYMMYCAGPRASKTMLALHIKLQSLFHLS